MTPAERPTAARTAWRWSCPSPPSRSVRGRARHGTAAAAALHALTLPFVLAPLLLPCAGGRRPVRERARLPGGVQGLGRDGEGLPSLPAPPASAAAQPDHQPAAGTGVGAQAGQAQSTGRGPLRPVRPQGDGECRCAPAKRLLAHLLRVCWRAPQNNAPKTRRDGACAFPRLPSRSKPN